MGGPDAGKQENMLHYNVCFCFLPGKQVTRPLVSEPGRGGAAETPGSRPEPPAAYHKGKIRTGGREPSSNMNLVNLMFTDLKNTTEVAISDWRPCWCDAL